MKKDYLLSRRHFLKVVGVGSSGLALPSVTMTDVLAQTANPIVSENLKPGSTGWIPFNPADNGEIAGYASSASINKGQAIRFYVSTAAPSYTIDIYRLGWYGGFGGRRIAGPFTKTGLNQPIPMPHPITGMVECNWTYSHHQVTTSTWVSGIYVAILTTLSGKQQLIQFVLRDDARPTKLMFQRSITTDQAYNGWGGKSLYEFNSSGGVPALKVSFNRPYDSASQGAGFLFNWEFQMLRFLEREGYDVKYCTNIDIHARPTSLSNVKGFLSVGHDEYWSYEMRQNIEAARDSRVNLGFFSANTCYWQVRLEPSSLNGVLNRTMVCYKNNFGLDPLYSVDNRKVTTLWGGGVVNRPEDALLGVRWNFLYPVNGDIVIEDPTHPFFQGTGLVAGSRLVGLAGSEADNVQGNAPATMRRICHSPVTDGIGNSFTDMTVYTASSGATVFAAGTCQWSWGLDDGGGLSNSSLVSAAARQITRNVLGSFA
jgi:hypothetical protein